jgi:uncharacterized metal-binding protein YceD (DUF177 family)
MDYLEQFEIPFKGLGVGMHHFDFVLGKKFFESLDYSEIGNGSVAAQVELEKEPDLLRFRIRFRGSLVVSCDRCLEEFDYPVGGEEELLVRFGSPKTGEAAEVIYLPESENKINLSGYLYEMIYLMLPIRKVHPDDSQGESLCNKEILRKIKELSGSRQTDPRWDKLKGLRDHREK